MAHGRHRRSTPRKMLVSLSELMGEVNAPAAPERSLLIDQDHMVHDGDDTEQVFNLMACVHPAQCACETAYPNWAPGMR